MIEGSTEQITGKVFIDCPVCCSGNRFRLGETGEELTCDDCGFVLAGAHELKAADSARCVFCGGTYFYFISPLPLLGRKAVCYVCQARYQDVLIHEPVRKFSPDTHAEAQNSDASQKWRQRIESYNQETG